MFKFLPSEHDEPIKYAFVFIGGSFLVAIIIFLAWDRLELAARKSLIKEFLQLTKKGNCIDAYSYLSKNLIAGFEVIKAEALNKHHGKRYIRIPRTIPPFSRCKIILSKDLKTKMTQEQINKLKPIDLFCWWNKHYNHLNQDSYDISLSSIIEKDTHYRYVIKDKDKVVGHIGVIKFSRSEPKIESIPLCSDYN